MKTLQTNIDEVLFSKGSATIADRIDASYKISRLPKNEKEYLNYMCAWNLVFQQCYETIEDSCKNMGELIAYIYRVYFWNLPDFHIQLKGTQEERHLIKNGYKYDADLDSYLAGKGKLSYNESSVNSQLDEMTSLPDEKIRQIRKIRNNITDIAYSGKLNGNVTTEAWVIARRAEFLSSANWTEAKTNKVVHCDAKSFYENSMEMLGWIDVIKSTMMKSIYKKDMNIVFDSLMDNFN